MQWKARVYQQNKGDDIVEKRPLGSSELWVSALGMGCWQYGGGSYWGDQSQADVNEVVHGALDMGINYFDTAESYNKGESERSLGAALKGRRHQAIIGSKIRPAHTQAAVLRDHCEGSLKRMQTDYIDLYMLHWPLNLHSVKQRTDTNPSEALPDAYDVFETLQRLQREGKIRYIGISNHGILQMKEIQETGFPVVANELPYNLLSRAIEQTILPFCMEQEMGVIGYMPLLQGVLTGKYASLEEIPPRHARSRHFHHSRGEGTRHGEEGAEVEVRAALKHIASLAAELGITSLELSLAWAAATPGISSLIVGSRNRQQLEMNYRGAAYPLISDTVRRLNELTEPVLRKLGPSPDYYEDHNYSRIY
jgi:myo-inositol catabolism protein IolS